MRVHTYLFYVCMYLKGRPTIHVTDMDSVNTDVCYLHGFQVFQYSRTIVCLADFLLIHLKLFLVLSNNAAINVHVLTCLYSCLILLDKFLVKRLLDWREENA